MSFQKQLQAIARLAAPLAAARLGFVLLGMVDTAVVGRLGETELGAVGLGNSLFFAIVVLGGGVVMGVEPLIAQAVGAREHAHAREGLWQGVWVGAIISVPMLALGAAAPAVLEPFGVEVATATQATQYLWARLPAVPLLLLMASCRSYLQATEHTRPLVLAVVVANLFNLPLNVLLVFGDEGLLAAGLPAIGAPMLGVVGAGLASTVVTGLQIIVVIWALSRQERITNVRRRPSRVQLEKAFRVGWPIGLQRLAEIGIFTITGLLMAKISTRAVASHQIAMTLVTATFMVPLGISAAAAAHVGHAVGAGDGQGARASGFASVTLALAFMSGCALIMLLAPDSLARLLTNQQPVIDAARPLIIIGAFFQLADGLQVVCNGALRGMGDTRVVLYLNLAGHYLVGLPAGMLAAFVAGWGASGLWWGLFAGLTVVAVALLVRFARLSAHEVARL